MNAWLKRYIFNLDLNREMCISIALVHSVSKGHQPNLVALICVINVHQATKERENITHCS